MHLPSTLRVIAHGAGLISVIYCSAWLLRTELKPSAKGVPALNHQAIFVVQPSAFYIFSVFLCIIFYLLS